jgi:hypothetical protein
VPKKERRKRRKRIIIIIRNGVKTIIKNINMDI